MENITQSWDEKEWSSTINSQDIDSDEILEEGVTVVTVTHGRISLLINCIQSVCEQQLECDFPIYHYIIGDECPDLTEYASVLRMMFPNVRIWNISRHSLDCYMDCTPSRLAALRNIGIRKVRTTMVALLDDDNIYSTNHIRSLVDVLKRDDSVMAHSWRTIVYPNGDLYKGDHIPWDNINIDNDIVLNHLYDKGVLSLDSPIMKDSIHIDYNKYGICVDTSEWIGLTLFCRKYPFRVEINDEDTAEDGKWQELIISSKSKISCSSLPTLIYRLGGHSNTIKSNKNKKSISDNKYNPLIVKWGGYKSDRLKYMMLCHDIIMNGYCVYNQSVDDKVLNPKKLHIMIDDMIRNICRCKKSFKSQLSFNKKQPLSDIGSFVVLSGECDNDKNVDISIRYDNRYNNGNSNSNINIININVNIGDIVLYLNHLSVKCKKSTSKNGDYHSHVVLSNYWTLTY